MFKDLDSSCAGLVRRCMAACLAWTVAIAGCGGAGEGGVGVGGTGAFASGPISGFGSVIVNGIEFDDSSARVEDEDGALHARSELQLGMVVEVDSGPIGGSVGAPTATASRIRFGSEILGPVDSVDVAAGSLVVFGQRLAVAAATVFDARLPAGLASVGVGSIVEAYGFFDSARGGFVATRIEPHGGNSGFFKLRGPVHGLDAAARTFRVGAVAFTYATAPAGLTDGTFVRLQVQTAPTAGKWVVRSFGDGVRRMPDVDDARLRGPISSLTSTRQFVVNGQVVDASMASFPDGERGIAEGARVEVEGATAGGVLLAREVKIEHEADPLGEFQLKGRIASHQPAAQSFVLQGMTVFYGAPGVEFDKGMMSGLRVGADIEVRGVLSADGTQLLARRVRFRN